MTVIYIIGTASGEPTGYEGQYIQSYDATTDVDEFGYGKLTTTTDRSKALVFPSVDKALEFWRQQSTAVPYRPDGKPNRPLSCFTVEMLSDGMLPTLDA